MALGDGTGWNESAPADAGTLSEGAAEIRDLRIGTGDRVGKEHIDPAAASVGGEHIAGSAVAYCVVNEAALPTKRPDGTTDLDANDEGRLAIAEDTKKIYRWTGTAWEAINLATASSEKYWLFRQENSSGAGGGDFVSGGWRDRVFGTTVINGGAEVTYATGIFTFAAGTYKIRVRVPGYQCDHHQVRLLNNDTATAIEYGSSEKSAAASDSQTWSELVYRVTFADTTHVKVQHRCYTTSLTYGMGMRTYQLFDVKSVWASLEAWKEF